MIPDVVILELAYQKRRQMLKAYKDARANLRKVDGALKLGIPEVGEPEPEKMLDRILAKLRDQVKATPHCQSVAVPYEAIGARFKTLVNAALYHEPPFPDGNGDKGFRDALVLETIRHFRATAIHSDIALLTKDALLRQATEREFGDANNFGVFGTLRDYRQFLNLARSRFTPEFLHTVSGRAKDITLMYALCEEIENRLQARHGLFPGREMSVPPPRQCMEQPSFYYSTTKLVSVVGVNEFHWATTIVASAPYSGRGEGIIGSQMPPTFIGYRVIGVSVEWAALANDVGELTEQRVLREQEGFDMFVANEQELENLRQSADLFI